MSKPPGYIEIISSIVKISSKHSWFYAYVPWMFVLLCVVPVFFVWKMGVAENFVLEDQSIVMSLSAFLVIGGVLAAACIASMTQVQQICSTWPFSDYLAENGLFDEFTAIPQLVFLIQIFSITEMSISIVFVFLFDLDFYLLIFNTGLVVYISFKTFSLLDLIRRLNWHYSLYLRLLNQE